MASLPMILPTRATGPAPGLALTRGAAAAHAPTQGHAPALQAPPDPDPGKKCGHLPY